MVVTLNPQTHTTGCVHIEQHTGYGMCQLTCSLCVVFGW